MICSSVNLDRFIRPSLPSGRTLRIFGGASGGQVNASRPPAHDELVYSPSFSVKNHGLGNW
jgi:hypothetical protein